MQLLKKPTLKEKYHAIGKLFRNYYFRAQLVDRGGATESPSNDNPVIFASNHSGMNFPWDNIMLYQCLKEHYGEKFKLEAIATPALFGKRMLNPFAVSSFWTLYCKDATFENFERLADAGQNILYNPEGLDGIGKGFNYKYQLQRFSSSFVRVGLKYNRDIVPVYVINGEYLNPFAYRSKILNRIGQKLGIPYIPVGPLTPLYLLFPFLMYISLPARLRYVTGARINLSHLVEKPLYEMTTQDFRDVTDRLQKMMQTELDANVAEFGQEKFGWREFFRSFRKLGLQSTALIPLTWPFIFHRVDADASAWRKVLGAAVGLSMVVPLVGWPFFLMYSLLGRQPDRPFMPVRRLGFQPAVQKAA